MMFLLSSSKRIPCYLCQFSTRFMNAKARMIFFPSLLHSPISSTFSGSFPIRPSVHPSFHPQSIHPSSSIQFHDACAEAANGMIITGETQCRLTDHLLLGYWHMAGLAKCHLTNSSQFPCPSSGGNSSPIFQIGNFDKFRNNQISSFSWGIPTMALQSDNLILIQLFLTFFSERYIRDDKGI